MLQLMDLKNNTNLKTPIKDIRRMIAMMKHQGKDAKILEMSADAFFIMISAKEFKQAFYDYWQTDIKHDEENRYLRNTTVNLAQDVLRVALQMPEFELIICFDKNRV